MPAQYSECSVSTAHRGVGRKAMASSANGSDEDRTVQPV